MRHLLDRISLWLVGFAIMFALFFGLSHVGDSAGAWVVFLFLLGLYFIPALVAKHRHHRNTTAITLLNVFLGWTVLGWVGALIWAVMNDRSPETPQPPRKD